MDNNMTFLNACRNGQKGIVQIFLKKGGIDVNKRDAEGNTPLYYACQKGYRDIKHPCMPPPKAETRKSSGNWYNTGRTLMQRTAMAVPR